MVRLAIPTWNNWVSPVFDTANTLLVVDVENNREVGRSHAAIQTPILSQRIQLIADLNINVLICNAISRSLMRMVATSGPEVIAWRSGPVEEILQAYLDGQLSKPRFVMAGCPRGGPGLGLGRGRCTRGGPKKE